MDEPINLVSSPQIDDVELGMSFNKSIKFLIGFFKQICPDTVAYFELMYGHIVQPEMTLGVSVATSPKVKDRKGGSVFTNISKGTLEGPTSFY